MLGDDWGKLAEELGVPPSDVKIIADEYPDNPPQQAMVMLRLWLRQHANKATGTIVYRNTCFYKCVFSLDSIFIVIILQEIHLR